MAPPTRTKPRLMSNLQIGNRGTMSVAELRAFAKNNPEQFVARTQELINKGELSFANITDIRSLFQALADVQVPVTIDGGAGTQRSMMASAFPVLTGGLAVAGMNLAYESVPTIGQELVQEIEDNKRVSTFANIHGMDKHIDTVTEGQDFPEISASEESMEIRSKRNGRMLSITMEAIEENNVADIARRVNALGEIASDWVEEQTLERICDKYGSKTTGAGEPYVYRPKAGGGTALYSSTANTPGTRAPSGTRVLNNALADETDLDAARAVLAAMKNERGKRIAIPIGQTTLLVPDALAAVASKILNSELVPGVLNEVNNWGPRGMYRPRLLSSPRLDDISTTAWYLGDFRRQFLRKWKLRFENVLLSGDQEVFLRKRIAFQARIAWDVEIGALDYVYAVQSLSGTTYTP